MIAFGVNRLPFPEVSHGTQTLAPIVPLGP
jgi:hypothetical protein